jgi:hypothetical protein
MRDRSRYIGWVILKATSGVRDKFVAKAKDETEAREKVRQLNQTEKELHWCEYWTTSSILSSGRAAS